MFWNARTETPWAGFCSAVWLCPALGRKLGEGIGVAGSDEKYSSDSTDSELRETEQMAENCLSVNGKRR